MALISEDRRRTPQPADREHCAATQVQLQLLMSQLEIGFRLAAFVHSRDRIKDSCYGTACRSYERALTGLAKMHLPDNYRLALEARVEQLRKTLNYAQGVEPSSDDASFRIVIPVTENIGNPSAAPVIGRETTGRESLTRREREVLKCIAEGNSTKQVAGMLGITFKTASCHRGRIMDKLGVHNLAGLVRYAIRERMIQA